MLLSAIGAPGFEPGTSPTRTVRATRLRHAPKAAIISELPLRGVRLALGSVAYAGDRSPAGVVATGEGDGIHDTPTGGDPIADVPTVDLAAGSNLIVYAVGGLDDGTFTFYTQEITGLGGTPTAVNTGDALDDANSTGLNMVLLVAAGVLALTGGGLVVAGRRTRS